MSTEISKHEVAEVAEVAITTEAESMLSMIYRAAKDPDFDADKMDKIIALKERMDDREAIKAFNRALVAFKSNPPRIIKNMAVSFSGTSYKHASIDSVCRQLDGPLNELGLSFRWRIESNGANVRVYCILSHVDGHSEESFMEDTADTSGKKNAIQGKGSTVTYLKRYTLLAALGLAEQGEDDDGMQGALMQRVDESDISEIEAMIETVGADIASLCKFFKIGSLPEMSVKQKAAAMAMLKAKVKK